MISQFKVLTEAQTKEVSGGDVLGTALAIGGAIYAILELPHVFMGIREFTNYAVDLYQNGCHDLEDNDHFTQFFCKR